MGNHAKVLTPAHVRRLLNCTSHHRHATRSRVIILLSFKAGLRAGEIAGLTWAMVLRPDGKLGTHVRISGAIAKGGNGRSVPLNPDLKQALDRLRREGGQPATGAVVRSERGGHMTPRSIVNWFAQLYRDVGYDGCSSHSGRRTFITQTARLLEKVGGSLRDVQELAGHSYLSTTQRYIEGDRQVQRKLVRMI